MDYKLKLMQILECLETMEGTAYNNYWADYGIMEDEQEQIEKDYKKYKAQLKA